MAVLNYLKIVFNYGCVYDFVSLDETDVLGGSSRLCGSISPDLLDTQFGSSAKQTAARKTPESFLGPNAALVNLDSLVSQPIHPSSISNPFLATGMNLRICFPFKLNSSTCFEVKTS